MIGVLVGLAYGAMYALVLYVEPTTREMTERVPTDKINPVRKPLPTPAAPAADEEVDTQQ